MNADQRYDSLIRFYAEKYQRDARQVKCQIRAESGFNPRAQSPVGAKGLMQFMDPTWAEIAPGQDVFNPEAAIEAGCKYMAALQKQAGSLPLALAAYNWGIGHVLKIKTDDNWRAQLPPETSAYLAKCLQFNLELVG